MGQPVPAGHRAGHGRGRGGAGRRAGRRSGGPAWSAARWAACGPWSGRRREPDRVRRLFLLACPAAASADQIGWAAPQLAAIRGRPGLARRRLPRRPPGEGPHRGLGIARRMAHLSYRSAVRAGHAVRPGGAGRRGPAARRALRRGVLPGPPRREAGAPLRRRVLRAAHRDDERARRRAAGVAGSAGGAGPGAARGRWSPGSTRTGSTRWSSRCELAAGIPDAGELRVIESPYGHDGFLIEAADGRAGCWPSCWPGSDTDARSRRSARRRRSAIPTEPRDHR